MKKYIVIATCFLLAVVVASGITFAKDKAKNKNQTTRGSHLALTTHQKEALKKARKSGKPMTDAEMDAFTIGQGKEFFLQYLKQKHLNYKPGSQKYFNLLNEKTTDDSTKMDKYPKFWIISAYSDIYATESQKKGVSHGSQFQLKKSTLDKTIKQIRHDQN